jgi:transcriptional regulator with XRE-family HTH domain
MMPITILIRNTEMRDPRLEKLASYVKETRKRKNLNQALIRERGGPSSGWLGELESGAMTTFPKTSTLKKLAKGLNEDLEDVLFAAGIEPPNYRPLGNFLLIHDWIRTKGLAATVDRIRNSPKLHEALQREYEFRDEILNEDAEKLEGDEYDPKYIGRLEIIHQTLREFLNVVDNGRNQLIESEFMRLLEELDENATNTVKIPFADIHEFALEDWKSNTSKRLLALPDYLFGGVTAVVPGSGSMVLPQGLKKDDWFFVVRVTSKSLLNGDEVLALVGDQIKFRIYRSDPLGDYLESVTPEDSPWRIPLSPDIRIVAVVASILSDRISDFRYNKATKGQNLFSHLPDKDNTN